ncbi:MAG: SIS domain-containing protein [Draconibacterium sp.]
MTVDELYEIPYRAELCYQKNKGIILPEGVPYTGMGASYIAVKAFRYLGIDIYPEKAADYFNYLVKNRKLSGGVLISQSGESSETLWCADYFSSFTALVNNEKSMLAAHPNCSKQILLYSGSEKRIVSKTYLNTLLVMYMGFGFDPREVIQVYKTELSYFEKTGLELGELIRKRMKGWRKRAIYILGNGPNTASAEVAALILSEVLKKPVHSMSVSSYDHGYKETSKNTLVIAINHDGPEKARTRKLLKTIKKAGGEVFELNNAKVEPVYSPLTYPLFFFFAAEYLMDKLKVKSIFTVGNKVTRVDQTAKDEQ